MKIKTKKTLIKTLLVVSILSFPFITMTDIIGIDSFIDSFENPENYILINNEKFSSDIFQSEEKYIIIQKNSHPDFNIDKKDKVIYFTETGEICSSQILDITATGAYFKYKIKNHEDINSESIYNYQIIGKIIKTIDDGFLNTLSLKLWEASISNININQLSIQ